MSSSILLVLSARPFAGLAFTAAYVGSVVSFIRERGAATDERYQAVQPATDYQLMHSNGEAATPVAPSSV